MPTVFVSKEIADTYKRAATMAAEDGVPVAVWTGPEGQVYADPDTVETPLDVELGWNRVAIAYPSTAFAGGVR